MEGFSLFGIVLFLRFLNQRDNIAHSKDTIGHSIGVEDIESIKFFAGANEFYGFINNGTYGEGCTATGITIELGKHNAVKVEPIVKFLCGVYRILAGHGVDYEKDFIG